MFPTLFDPIYTPQAYTFGHSSAQRTRSSCEAFSEGLFGSGMMQWYSAIHFFTDNLLLRVCIVFYLLLLYDLLARINILFMFCLYSHGLNVRNSMKYLRNWKIRIHNHLCLRIQSIFRMHFLMFHLD